jgi:uncharacterized protein YjiS (DUF1127 family)
MLDNRTFVPASYQARRPSRQPAGLASLRRLLATWSQRRRFRRDLVEMAKTNLHMIEDIGLTRQQAEAEVTKPFWRA